MIGNDTDPDGVAPAAGGLVLTSVAIVAGSVTPAGAGTVATVPAGGRTDVRFTPAAGFSGQATFQYTIADNGTPALTSTGTVTVNVTAGVTQTVTVTLAQFRTSINEFRVTGTSLPVVAGNTITVTLVRNGAVVGTSPVDAVGA